MPTDSHSLLGPSTAELKPTSPQAADEARGLAMDSIKKASSGHMGLPLGCAEIGAVLFGQEMYASPIQWNPTAPCLAPPSSLPRTA